MKGLRGLAIRTETMGDRQSKSGGAASLAILLGLSLTAVSFGKEFSPQSLTLWNFERGSNNQWGGRYNAFAHSPSSARTYLDPTVHHGNTGHSLRVTVHREEQGFCGVWMTFYPPAADENRQFVNAIPYRFLSFWIRGETGGEDLEFELTDEAHEAKGDPTLTRPLRAYLRGGITAGWQEVLVPLADFQVLDLRQITRFSVKFTRTGDYRVYLDDLSLKADKSASLPEAEKLSAPAPADPFAAAQGRMWVWHTRDLFEGPHQAEAVDKFFAFCSTAHLHVLYLSLDFADDAIRLSRLRDANQYRAFIARAHRQGLSVEALAGSAEWAARENHSMPLAVVNTVLDFNQSAPEASRFDGVHFDVEPYLLVDYADIEDRPQLLADYLQMVSECQARLRAEGNLRFSCDVPAWWYPADPAVRQELTATYRGVTKIVGEHLTDLLDTVTIMDYRNQADGPNGVIAFGKMALEYAASKGKKVVVGLETSLEPETKMDFVCGLPSKEFHQHLVKSKLRYQGYVGGFRFLAFRDGTNVHAGLQEPRQLTAENRPAFEKTWFRIARELGAASGSERFSTGPMLQAAREGVEQDPEWKDFEPFERTDPETHQKIQGFHATYRMPAYITFYGFGRKVLAEEASSVIEWLGRYPSFAGLAFHYYDTFQTLMSR